MDRFDKLIHLERAALFLLVVLLPVLATTTQESSKTLEWGDHANLNCGKVGTPSSRITYEIELEDILIDGRSVLIGEPFVGDVRNLVFRVRNISDRPVGFIQITVILPEVKRPPQIPFVRAAESKATPVQPGQATELRVPAGKLYDWVNDTVSAQGLELLSIKRAAIDGIIVEKDGKPAGSCMTTRDQRNERRSK